MSTFAVQFCEFHLAMLVQSGILVFGLLLLDRVIRARARAVVRYSLWLLVLVKLVLPTTLRSPAGVGQWVPPASGILEPRTPGTDVPAKPFDLPATVPEASPENGGQFPASSAPASAVASPATGAGTDSPPSAVEAAEKAPVYPPPPPSAGRGPDHRRSHPPAAPFPWPLCLFWCWLIVVLFLFALLLARYQAVRRLLARSERLRDGDAYDQLVRCGLDLGLRHAVELRLTVDLTSPAVCGLWHPVILMPAGLVESLSADRLRVIFTHELCHLKRGDLWVNLLQSLLQILYFLNPFLWLANARIRSLREKAVDEMALSYLDGDANHYGSTLIDVVELTSARRRAVPRLVGVVESRHALGDRIRHILSRSFPASAKLGLLGAAAVVLLAFVLLPMGQEPPPTFVPAPNAANYGTAHGSVNGQTQVGPSLFRLRRVARYAREGTPVPNYFDDAKTAVPVPNLPPYPALATWMDIANVYWTPGPDAYDPVELRVFDHRTRRDITTNACLNFGYSLDSSSLTVYSIGRHLPDSLDIWLRIAHKRDGQQTYSLKPTAGESVLIGETRIRVVDIAKGRYDSGGGNRGTHHGEWDRTATTVWLHQYRPKETEYQICAVGRDGRRALPQDYPWAVGRDSGQLVPMVLPMALEDIDHLELRPYLGRDTFFFDDVRLPVRAAPLDRPPVIRFAIDGKPGTYRDSTLPFASLELTVKEHARVFSATIENRSACGFRDESIPGTALILHKPGLRISRPRLIAYGKDGKVLSPARQGMAGSAYAFQELPGPAEDIAAVELHLDYAYLAFRPRFVGIAGAEDDTLYDRDGKPVGTCPYPVAGNNGNQRLLFDFPTTDQPIQFVVPWFADRCNPASLYPLPVVSSANIVDVFEGRQRLVVNARLEPEYLPRRRFPLSNKKASLDRFDYTLRYYYGPRGQFHFRFQGPLKTGVPIPADGGKPYTLTVTKPSKVPWNHETQLHFRLAGPAPFPRDIPLVYHNPAGERVMCPAPWYYDKIHEGSNAGSLEFDMFDTDLSQIALLGAEIPLALTVPGIKAQFPGKDAPKRKLGTETLSAFIREQASKRYSDEALANTRKLAMESAKARSAYQHLLGVQAGVRGHWPEFTDMALAVASGEYTGVYGYTIEDGRMVYHANMAETGIRTRLDIVESLRKGTPLDPQQLQKVKAGILGTDNPEMLGALFHLLWPGDTLPTIEICKELAADDRPWIWLKAIELWRTREAGALNKRVIERDQRTDIRAYPEKMRLRLALGGSFQGNDLATYHAANQMVASHMDARLLFYAGGEFDQSWGRIVRELGREEATPAAIRFLQQATDPAVQAMFFRTITSRDYSTSLVHTTMRLACQVNLWYDLGIGGLAEKDLGDYGRTQHIRNRAAFHAELIPRVNAVLQWRREHPDATPVPLAIRGRVVDPDGKGIGGARVTVRLSRRISPFGYRGADFQTLACSPDGSFVLTNPERRDIFELSASADGYQTKDNVQVELRPLGYYLVGTNNTIELAPGKDLPAPSRPR